VKIAIVSAIWQRERLTEIFLKSVQRYWKDYGIPTMIAGSEGVKTREMCLDYGAGYVEAPNRPLGAKFIKASVAAWANYNPDALMILGSDDFVNHSVIYRYQICLEQKWDVVGFRDCYFYDNRTKQAAYWGGYTVKHRQGESIGMGRLLSRRVYEKLKGRLWMANINAGLDWVMTQKIKKHKDLKHRILSVKGNNHVLVDVKGFGNLSDWGCYDLEPVDNGVFNTIPEMYEIQQL